MSHYRSAQSEGGCLTLAPGVNICSLIPWARSLQELSRGRRTAAEFTLTWSITAAHSGLSSCEVRQGRMHFAFGSASSFHPKFPAPTCEALEQWNRSLNICMHPYNNDEKCSHVYDYCNSSGRARGAGNVKRKSVLQVNSSQSSRSERLRIEVRWKG